MADADAEQPPVPVADGEVPPGEELPPPEVKPEEGMDSGADRFAYWKTYPGIWKILQFIFFAIALICIIICLTPAMSDHEGCIAELANYSTDPKKEIYHTMFTWLLADDKDTVAKITDISRIPVCYNSLTVPDGDWGSGRHDIWLYAWAFLIFGGFCANITIIILQYKNSNFVFNKKKNR